VFLKILAELGYPPIWMISPEQFKHIEGVSVKGCYGISSTTYPVFTIDGGLRGKAKANTIYHEIGHLLFPNWPHWKIDLYGEIMARGGGRGHWANKYGKKLEDMPNRAYLLKLSKRAVKRMKYGKTKNINHVSSKASR
jgi:hypothetical protein